MSTTILTCGHEVQSLFDGVDSIEVIHQGDQEVIRYSMMCQSCHDSKSGNDTQLIEKQNSMEK